MPVGANPIAIRVGRPGMAAPIPPGPGPTLSSVQGGGFLPTTFIDRDNYRFRHVLLVRQPVAGTLEGLVVQASDAELGLGADAGTAIRDTDLGRIVQRMGSQGGARFTTNPIAANATIVQGNGGSWGTNAADWAASGFTPQTGRAAATVSYGNAVLLSDYLNRYDIGIPEANTMRAGLNMGNNSIAAANDVAANTVTAANTVVAGASAVYNPSNFPGVSMYMNNGGIACAGNATGCKFWISDDGGFADYNDGWIRYQGQSAGAGLSIEGAGNNLYVGGNTTVAQDLAAGGASDLSGDVNAHSNLYVGQNVGVSGDVNANGNVSAAVNLNSGQDTGVGRNLHVNGSASIVQDLGTGRDVYAGRNLSVTQDASVSRNLIVAGDSWLQGYLTVNGGASVSGSLNVGQNATVGGDAGIGGNLGVSQDLHVGGVTTVGQEVRLAGTAAPGAGCAVNGAITASADGSGRPLSCINGRWGSPTSLATSFYSIPGGLPSNGSYSMGIGRHAYCAASEVYNQLNVVPVADYGDGTWEWAVSEPTPSDSSGSGAGSTTGGTAACVN